MTAMKPGRDFIALINLPLFIAVIFVIIFYSEMAKDSGSLAQSIAENHFSTGMSYSCSCRSQSWSSSATATSKCDSSPSALKASSRT